MEKYKLHDTNTLIKAIQEKRKKKKKQITPEQLKIKKRRQQLKARDKLRDHIEGVKEMPLEERSEHITKAFKKSEVTACRNLQHEIDDRTLLITLLNKYHAKDEDEHKQIHLEKLNNRSRETNKKNRN